MASTIEEYSIILLVIITAIYVVLTGFILCESRRQRIQNNASTRQIIDEAKTQRLQDKESMKQNKESMRQLISETKSQRFQDKHSTKEILQSAKLQRTVDAELRTMIKIKGIVIPDFSHEIRIDAMGDYYVQDWNFTVDFIDDGSVVESKSTKGFSVDKWQRVSIELVDPLENINYWTIDILDLFKPWPDKYVKEQSFQLHITANFKSFLGRDWEFKYKSVDLLMNNKMEMFSVGRIIPCFNLTKVTAPWDNNKL